MTQCTVAPASLTPWARAARTARTPTPGNDGNNDGWVLTYAKRADQLRIEDTQKAGQHNQVGAVCDQRSLECPVPVAAIRITVERYDEGRDLGSGRSLQGAGTGPVRSHRDDLAA